MDIAILYLSFNSCYHSLSLKQVFLPKVDGWFEGMPLPSLDGFLTGFPPGMGFEKQERQVEEEIFAVDVATNLS